jgi:hypothetical protein
MLDEQRALLVKFCGWCADHGYLDSSFGGVDAFLVQLSEPLPSCPVCGAVRGDWECRHGAKDEPAPPADPYCIHGHLTTTEQCPQCAEILAERAAQQWMPGRMRCRRCNTVIWYDDHDRPGSPCVECGARAWDITSWPQPPPAPQQFWRAVRLVPGECWQVEFVDASGRPYKRGACHYERDYPRHPMMAHDMARVEGEASGLPEFEGGERSRGSRTRP